MVKVTFKPYEEPLTREPQKFELSEMVRLRCTGMHVRCIAPNWAKTEK